MAIGGAEDKLRKRTILKRFVEMAGGQQARVAVVPTASALGPEIIDVYDALFTKLGAREVIAARPTTREEADSDAMVALLDDVTGIFMTGGNQLKLSAIINGTRFGEAIKHAHRRGVVVAGTSAGASIQSSHMVAFGPGGATPKQRMTQVAAGLGLVPDCVIDQHFAQRNRYGRLLSIVAQSPNLLGIGIDEDTAMIVTRDGHHMLLEVAGRGAVTVVDGHDMVTNAYDAKGSSPLLASGVTLHVLPARAVFDLTTRTLRHRGDVTSEAETRGLAVAGDDLSRLARDIAAADASPTTLRRRMSRRTGQEPGGKYT
jgi:cyanophycinase